MTRDEAVSIFESEGLHAFKRDWAMGETVGAAVLDETGEDGPEAFRKVIYVFPIKDQWGIHTPGLLSGIHYSRCYSMERACEVALKFLRCEFLPLSPESVVIHHIRSESGGYQVMEHVPTGTKRMLTRPTAMGGGVLLGKSEAADEIAYELALDAGSRGSSLSVDCKKMESVIYDGMRDVGVEVIRRDGRLYVRYDAGAHAAMWREDEITEEELQGILGGRSSCNQTMLAIQRRLFASGVDAHASNWKAGG